ncbi:MAG: ComEA family DNA-binding protein [Coriobacteriia bacterium]|nr:ComEA family DNA-binding protein [Coriobacteriia bacterium]
MAEYNATPPPLHREGASLVVWQLIESKLEGISRRAGISGVAPPVLVAAALLCAIACVWGVWRFWPQPVSASDAPPRETAAVSPGTRVQAEASAPAVASAPPAGVVVHVAGAVRHPGVYELPSGSRVADAVDASGGMLPDAVPAAVNLARLVVDGEQVVVPSEDDPISVAPPPAAAGGGAGASGAAGSPAGAPVDLNSADAAALDTLPGIGPATAAKIVADREANGPFASVEDLSRVSGIGEKKCEQLAGLACVR